MKIILSPNIKIFNRIVSKPKEDRLVSKMYKAHKYWARKPWYVVREYIDFFTKPGDKVLDIFAGSGVTGVEAIAIDREAFLVDLNPMASFISETTAINVDINLLKGTFEKIRTKYEQKIDRLYQTKQKCPHCKSILIARHFLRGPAFDVIKVKEECRNCGFVSKKPRPITKLELNEIKIIESKKINYWYPKDKFPEKFDKDRVTYKGIKYIYQLFTKRNLLALTWLFNEINKISDNNIKKMMRLVFSNTLLHVSKLKAENVRPMAVNNYWVPDDWIEENVWFRFAERFKKILEAKKISNQRISPEAFNKLKIYTQSSTKLKFIKSNSIDYCFNDPPYGDSIQYSELSMVWNAWMKRGYKNKEEVIVNRFQNKRVEDYQELLTKVYKETFRVLKPGSYMTVCFHNKDFRTWSAILQACKDAGFLYINVVPQNPISKSFNQAWSEKSPKTDMLMNFVKPNGEKLKVPKEYTYLEEFNQLIKQTIRNLKKQKKSPNLGNVYDGVLSRVVGYSFYTNNNLNPADYSLSKIKTILQSYATK